MTYPAETNSCIVVGAGMSGLVAARELSAAGWQVVALEEGSGVGGRLATQRMGNGNFDYGAQFFTVRSERFEKLVAGWLEAGVVEEWTRGFADADGIHNDDGYPRYRGSKGMNSVPEHLARGLDVRTGERVLEAIVRDGVWETLTGSGTRQTGAALVLTAPVPRSLALVGSGGFELARAKLENISYAPCLALTALLDGPTGVPEPGGMQIKGEPLDWIADNQRKGISEAPGITVHAGPEWSRAHFEADDAEITASLLSFAGERLGSDVASRVVQASTTRWRYSWVAQPHPEPCLMASEYPPLLFAGDAFGGAKVEGAVLSGLAAADRLLGRCEG
ncbi:MAG TPA: FAD-dependent oxidoreductase [Rubrobacter sp.]|nr:FAD-dependent oxidoreductase [Rubrobacter sp.]